MPMPKYPGTTEIVPGVFVCDDGSAVYFADQDGEIVMWTHEEVVEDPMVLLSCVSAVSIASTEGPKALRRFLDKVNEALDRAPTEPVKRRHLRLVPPEDV